MSFNEQDIKLAEIQFKLKAMADEVSKLQAEKDALLRVIKANGLEDEIGEAKIVSDEEFICINEIRKLKGASEIRDLSNDEAKMFEILFRTLRTIRTGKDPEPTRKQKPADVKELLKLVEANGNE